MHAQRRAAVLLAVLASLWGTSAAATPATQDSPIDPSKLKGVRVLFLTDCTRYSNWQALGDIFSFKMSNQPGRMNRVMCCTPEEQAKFDPGLLKEMDTWIAPSFTVHPRTGDVYLAYNKPEAVVDWTAHNTPEEEYVLVLDSDMLLRRTFLVEDMKPRPGWSVAASFGYMIGVANELADRHIPEIPKRNDTLAGPFGRRADQVGGFFFTEFNDLKRMAPGWLKYTEDVRADPEAYHLTGDVYAVRPGMKPWISEMYGYAYGAATAGLWHKWDTTSMLYPGYEPVGIPKLMHYGLLFEVGDYKFDKHWHYDFDPTICPPWDLSSKDVQKSSKSGIFPPPPRPSSLKNQDHPSQYYRDLLSIETVATLNAAFCDYHLKHCPPSHQLLEVCTEALSLYMETVKAIETVEPKLRCRDFQTKCEQWAKDNECKNNYSYMKVNCPKACGECHTISERLPKREPTETLQMLEKLKATLSVAKATGGKEVKEQAGADPDAAKVAPKPTSPAVVAKASPAKPAEVETKVAVDSPVAKVADKAEGQAEQVGTDAHKGQEEAASPAAKPRKELLLRCYRMNLKPKEVKECAAAAARGEAWSRSSSSHDDDEAAGQPKVELHHRADEDNAVEEAGQGDEEEDVEAPSPKRHRHAKRRQPTKHLRHGRRHDAAEEEADDEKLTKQEIADLRRLRQGGSDDDDTPGPSSLTTSLAGLSTTQAVILWALVLVALLYVAPRVLRRIRRRHRSGMRSD